MLLLQRLSAIYSSIKTPTFFWQSPPPSLYANSGCQALRFVKYILNLLSKSDMITYMYFEYFFNVLPKSTLLLLSVHFVKTCTLYSVQSKMFLKSVEYNAFFNLSFLLREICPVRFKVFTSVFQILKHKDLCISIIQIQLK